MRRESRWLGYFESVSAECKHLHVCAAPLLADVGIASVKQRM